MKPNNYPKNLQEFIMLYLFERDEYIQELENKIETLEESLYNFEHKKEPVICQGCKKVYAKNDRNQSRDWPDYIIMRCSKCNQGYICEDCANMNTLDSIYMKWELLNNLKCNYCERQK